MTPQSQCTLAKGFSLSAKLYAQGSFNVTWIVGTVGITLSDWRWAAPYLLIVGYGVPGVVMRHLCCPRCPHLHTYGDCLQAPARITKWLVKQPKSGPFGTWERWAFAIVFVTLPFYPLYWLRTQPALLSVFVAAASAWYLGQWLRFCKRCRVRACPFNRAGGALGASHEHLSVVGES